MGNNIVSKPTPHHHKKKAKCCKGISRIPNIRVFTAPSSNFIIRSCVNMGGGGVARGNIATLRNKLILTFFLFIHFVGIIMRWQLGELSQSNQRLELSSTRLDETQRRLDSRLGVISKSIFSFSFSMTQKKRFAFLLLPFSHLNPFLFIVMATLVFQNSLFLTIR